MTSSEEELRKAQSLAGRFVQNFATIELLVVCWLFRLEASEQDAMVFLTKCRAMASRVKRLGDLLQRAGASEAVSLAHRLATIEDLRRFRNAFLHGAGGIDEKDQIVLVGWKGVESFSRAAMEDHVDGARDMLLVLNDGYMARFGEHPSLQIAVKGAPPPTE